MTVRLRIFRDRHFVTLNGHLMWKLRNFAERATLYEEQLQPEYERGRLAEQARTACLR